MLTQQRDKAADSQADIAVGSKKDEVKIKKRERNNTSYFCKNFALYVVAFALLQQERLLELRVNVYLW